MLAPALATAVALLAAASPQAAAPGPDAPAQQVIPAPSDVTEGRRGFVLPMPFWLPETKAGLAVAAGREFRLEGSARSSQALAVAAYSMERQGSVDASADVYLRGGSLLAGRLRAVHYPDTFYGIGSGAPGDGHESYTRRFLELQLSGERGMLGGRLRAGPRVAARAEELLDLVPGGRLATSGLPGLDGFRALGAGGSVTWDDRDDPLWPTAGVFAQAYYVRYESLGAGDAFGKGALDLRNFHGLGGGRVLGLSAVVETTDGDTPFTLLSKLGSARFFRGYREGRFRDAVVWAAQAELRLPVWRRLAATAFAAVGDVAPDLGSLLEEGRAPKLAGGVGARYRLTGGGTNLRVDLAAGKDGPEVYVVLLEAF